MGQCKSFSEISVTGKGQLIRKGRIIIANTTGRLRFVAFGNKVIDLDIITERLKAVGKPLRDVELMAVHALKAQILPLR